MSGTFSRAGALMRPESPLPRRHTKASSAWNPKNQRAMWRGVAAISVLFILAYVVLRTGPSDLSASPHRKLGGHIAPAGSVTILDSKEVKKAVRTEDSDIVGIDSHDVVKVDTDTPKRVTVTSEATEHIPTPQGLYSLHALDIDGNDVAMSEFAGKTLLIVNVASACGYTDQNYKGLQELYTKYGGYGLEILAFPSNQFGGQEPGDEAAIKKFATEKYGVTFRLMSKVDVNGPAAHPIYKYIKKNLPPDQGGGGGIGAGNDLVWNFNKFLVDKHGRPSLFYYQHYDGPRLESDVYSLLSAP